MKLIGLLLSTLVLIGCQSSYITKDGQRLLGNSAIGCVAGQVLFDNCGAGAAVGAGATLIDDQTKD